ncbi:MAG: hypothetical protein OEW37_08755 [Rhodospirillaceae bacterium]|nr:hypothetical protein [Rhodospirillaceae bacterium]
MFSEDLAALFDTDDLAVAVKIDGKPVTGILLDNHYEVSMGPGVEARQVLFICEQAGITHAANGSVLDKGGKLYAIASIRAHGFPGVAEIELVDA